MRGDPIRYPAPESTVTAAGQLQEERHVWEYVVRTTMRRVTTLRLPYDAEEVQSIAAAAVARAWGLWDPRRGQQKRAGYLADVVWKDFQKVITHACRQCRNDGKPPVSLDAPIRAAGARVIRLREVLRGTDNSHEELFTEDQSRVLLRGLAALPEEQFIVLYRHFWGEETMAEIARERGYSRQRAHQIKNEGLAVLRAALGGDL